MKRGFVLIESLVALAVLSIGVIAVNRAMSEALTARALARDYTEARFLIEQKMGDLEAQPVLYDGAESGDFGQARPRFRWERTVEKIRVPEAETPQGVTPGVAFVYEAPVPFLVKISVTVRWTRARREYAETFQTLAGPDKVPNVNAVEGSNES